MDRGGGWWTPLIWARISKQNNKLSLNIILLYSDNLSLSLFSLLRVKGNNNSSSDDTRIDRYLREMPGS